MMVSSMAVNSALSIFCSPRSLFDILRFLCALCIPYDAVSACYMLGEISTGEVE